MNLVPLGSAVNCVKVVEVRPILSALICLQWTFSPKNLVFGNVWFVVRFSEVTEKQCVNDRYHPPPTWKRLAWPSLQQLSSCFIITCKMLLVCWCFGILLLWHKPVIILVCILSNIYEKVLALSITYIILGRKLHSVRFRLFYMKYFIVLLCIICRIWWMWTILGASLQLVL